jgi:CRISPR type II-A-associated protein Csn2
MKISYQAHDVIEVEAGKLVVLGTNSPIIYTDLVHGFQELNEKISVYDDEYNQREITKMIDWVGDVGTQDLVIQKYMTKIEKLFESELTDEQRNKIHDQMGQLFNTVSEQLFMLDLPISVNYDFELKRLFKYCGIRFDPLISNQPYGIIESIFKIHEECNLHSCVVLCNVAHYLTPTQFEELAKVIKRSEQSVLLIEFTEMSSKNIYGDNDFYYIDGDFIDWHV